MKLLTLCVVLSALLAVSLAGPLKTQNQDVSDSSSSNESIESKSILKKISSQEDEQEIGKKIEESSSETEEEQTKKKENIVKDKTKDSSSSEEDEVRHKKRYSVMEVDDNEILDIEKVGHKSKRSLNVDYLSQSNNQLKIKDEGSIKYEKYLKLKRLRRELNSNESKESKENTQRFVRNVDTSEENSSEEQKKAHEQPAIKPAEGVVIAEKPDTVRIEQIDASVKPDTTHIESESKPEEESVKTEAARRRRNVEDLSSVSSEENQSGQNQDINEVFIFSNENQEAFAKNFKSEYLKNNEYMVLNKNNVDKSFEKKTTDEDYAQGCGGINDNNDDDSW